MGEINNAGANRNIQQHQQILQSGQLTAKTRVSGGQLDGKDFTVSSRDASHNEATKGKNEIAPQLEAPLDTSLAELKSASAKLAEITPHTEASIKATSGLISSLASGEVTPEQTAQLQQHAATLLETSDYLENLKGKGLNTPEGKKSVLAALGFSDAQLDALLSLANPDDADNSLASLHGGVRNLDAKKAVLKSLGFSEGQIDALLSMANPDDEGNTLSSLHQSGAGPKEILKALGFQQQQIERLINLLNGNPDTAEFAEQAALLKQMGFSDAEAQTILSGSDLQMVKAQKVLLENTTIKNNEFLKFASEGMTRLAGGQLFAPAVTEQLVDMFAVMTLLHEMSVEQRRSARISRSVNYEAAKQQVLKQASELRNAATKTLTAGLISAGAKILSGAAQGIMAFRSGNAPNDGVRQQQVAYGNAASTLISGIGEVGKSFAEYDATNAQAQVKVHEAIQKTYDNAAQSDSEFLNMHQDMIRNVQSKMDEIIRSWFETLKSTTRV